jgi:hypothetical protein
MEFQWRRELIKRHHSQQHLYNYEGRLLNSSNPKHICFLWRRGLFNCQRSPQQSPLVEIDRLVEDDMNSANASLVLTQIP